MAKSNKTILDTLKDSESTTSIVFGAIVVIVIGLLIFNFMRSNRPSQVSETGEATESAQVAPNNMGYIGPEQLPAKHTVNKGEHLWGIAEKYYGSGYNWVDIANANSIKEGNSVNEGSELNIPAVDAKKLTAVTAQETVIDKSKDTPVELISGDSYVVKKGDSLWKIAVRAYGDGYKWTDIYNANKDIIKDSNEIDIGWTVKLPR